tara:strand:- start:1073 stop:1600 length:528 start_codon:yes stop_codon:yes gene_type:complete
MKKLLLLLTVFLFVAAPAQAKIKKVKIKEDKSIRFNYKSDSSDLKHKDNKLMLRKMYRFYKAIQDDDFDKFVSMLSPKTLDLTSEEKLKRKLKKFKMQNVRLMNTISVRSIRAYTGDNNEIKQIYSVIIKLPEGQSIPGRMGFDVLSRVRFEGSEFYAGLHMIRHEGDFKVVILY